MSNLPTIPIYANVENLTIEDLISDITLDSLVIDGGTVSIINSTIDFSNSVIDFNGSTILNFPATASGGVGKVVISTTGLQNIIVPQGSTELRATIWGGGGGGGAVFDNGGAGGGGSGTAITNFPIPVTAGDIINLTVGKGGSGGANNMDKYEVVTIGTVSSSIALSGSYFTPLTTNVATYYVWFNVDALSPDPAVGGTPIEVNILSSDDANMVASKLQVQLDALAELTASVIDNLVTYSEIAGFGPAFDAPDPVDFGTGFSFNVTNGNAGINATAGQNTTLVIGSTTLTAYGGGFGQVAATAPAGGGGGGGTGSIGLDGAGGLGGLGGNSSPIFQVIGFSGGRGGDGTNAGIAESGIQGSVTGFTISGSGGGGGANNGTGGLGAGNIGGSGGAIFGAGGTGAGGFRGIGGIGGDRLGVVHGGNAPYMSGAGGGGADNTGALGGGNGGGNGGNGGSGGAILEFI